MIHIKKQLILSALVLTVASVGLGGVTAASAQNATDTTLVQKIAQKFNLNQNEVQALFDQERSEKQSKMQEKMNTRLDQLVKDGKLTEAQKKLILEKQKELLSKKQAHMEGIENMTDEERKAQMEKHRQELEDWAEKNGIDLKYMHMMGHGMKGHFIMKMK